jgi:hypothetical protein
VRNGIRQVRGPEDGSGGLDPSPLVVSCPRARRGPGSPIDVWAPTMAPPESRRPYTLGDLAALADRHASFIQDLRKEVMLGGLKLRDRGLYRELDAGQDSGLAESCWGKSRSQRTGKKSLVWPRQGALPSPRPTRQQFG